MKKPIPFGKYTLLERINVGGMAEVFRAKAYGVEGFERLVAVKRILPNIAEDKEFISMFIDEAKIAVQLNHANIAQIFDLGVVDGAYFIALEHVHGRDLRAIYDRCRQKGEPMPIAQACFVSMKVCEGLDYAHNKRDATGREMGLVHRDVSPQNMLVSFEGEVKLIDFGIAKAAGKGAKTQQGILKGKFGYMSPEQVRGLPVDRRSDIFASGIVLYELLTGERLFVGDSDFSTLEKVRNVEILPPSTYNRRIPDELERIVLKALAKDVDDRYQNAIDLHDELQAFVYTAGEFYSRKDLAGWMKKTFVREIEEETAKLEAFRQLPAPPASDRPPTVPDEVRERDARPTKPQPVAAAPGGAAARRTLSMAAMPKPPPPPQVPAARASTNGMRGPTSPSMQAAAAPAPAPGDLEWEDEELETQIYDHPPDQVAPRPSGQFPAQPGAGAPPMPMAAGPGASSPAMQSVGPSAPTMPPMAPPLPLPPGAVGNEPDLSSLVRSTGKQWPVPTPPMPPGGAGAPTLLGMPAPNIRGLAAGSGQAQSPFVPAMSGPPMQPDYSDPMSPPPLASDPSAVVRLANLAQQRPIYDSGFGGQVIEPAPRSRAPVFAAIAAVLLLAGGGTAAVLLMGSKKNDKEATSEGTSGTQGTELAAAGPTDKPSGDKPSGETPTGETPAPAEPAAAVAAPSEPAAAGTPAAGAGETPPGAGAPAGTAPSEPAAAGQPAVAAAVPAAVDPETGFDLFVDPAGADIKLDGDYIGKAPLRVRKVTPGKHVIEVAPPAGFFAKKQDLEVVNGKAETVQIKLDAMEIAGHFTSEPPGAEVTLVSDGQRTRLGPSPASAKLDPRRRYEVVFEKDGYVTVTRPVEVGSGPEVSAAAVLERATVAVRTPRGESHRQPAEPRPRPTRPVRQPRQPAEEPSGGPGANLLGASEPEEPSPTPPKGGDHATHEVEPPAAPAEPGVVMIGSKPVCQIFIDGKDTGKHTPQLSLELKPGRHKITLVNNEYSIRETVSVTVKSGEKQKVIKDMSDRIKP